jgi:hypothetical protein
MIMPGNSAVLKSTDGWRRKSNWVALTRVCVHACRYDPKDWIADYRQFNFPHQTSVCVRVIRGCRIAIPSLVPLHALEYVLESVGVECTRGRISEVCMCAKCAGYSIVRYR